MDPIVVKGRQALIDAGINPIPWQLVLQELQALIQACGGGASAKKFITAHPLAAKLLIRRKEINNGATLLEADQTATACVTIGQASTEEDFTALAAVDLMAVNNQPIF